MGSHRFFDNAEHLRDPLWFDAGRIHDWRNYVGKRTRYIWDGLTDEERLAIAGDAEERAQAEEWD